MIFGSLWSTGPRTRLKSDFHTQIIPRQLALMIIGHFIPSFVDCCFPIIRALALSKLTMRLLPLFYDCDIALRLALNSQRMFAFPIEFSMSLFWDEMWTWKSEHTFLSRIAQSHFRGDHDVCDVDSTNQHAILS